MKASKESLISYLVSSELVSWLGLLGGDFQCGVSICVRTVPELSEFLTKLGDKFGGIFFEKSIAVLSRLYHFRMKYLSPRKGPVDYLEIGGTPSRFKGDELDHKILSTLVKSSSPTRREVAAKLGIPHSTVDYRIARMEKERVIVGHTYLANTSAFGVHMYLLVLYVKTVDEKFKRSLFDFCAKHQNVNFLIEYLGAWDYEIGVEVENAKDILTITEQVYASFAEMLNTVKVLQVFDYPKVSKYPFRSYSSLNPDD
jgi:DNA-binding Lrp family transcriptional regulator